MLIQRKSRGFNLVELMVSITIGLVITGAVTSFVASMVANSSETIQSSRLTQELRTLTEVVAREIRRARALSDPIAKIGTGCTTTNTCGLATITVSTGCVLYTYEGATGGNFRMIRRAESGGVGSLVTSAGNAAQTCNTAGTQVNSNVVDVTGFDIAVDAANSSRVDIAISGRLRGDSSGTVSTFRTSVFIRSG